jgi:uncharacterized protein YbjT (DUF2867 family)
VKVLLTGATGYVGGRLLPLLVQDGHQLRVMARRPDFLLSRIEAEVEVVEGDARDTGSLHRALDGIEVAYYLIHSMGSGEAFAEQDRRAARAFGQEAKRAGVSRIIYLGGLAREGDSLSDHMASRLETGRILRQYGPPLIELRASIVIGSGSLSFEMVRSLAEKLPVLVTPSWVKVKAQPIAIRDLLAYLREAAHVEADGGRVVEIGGTEVLSYGDLVMAYAEARGLKRFMLPVPFLSPRLSSLWLGLVTPLYARVGRWLIESIRHPSVVTRPESTADFHVTPMGAREAIRLALEREESSFAATRWSDSLSSSGSPGLPWGGLRKGSRLIDTRSLDVNCPPEKLFQPVYNIGGRNGWYAWNLLWQLRGLLDLLAGGVGMRRGRPRDGRLRAGDALDFWRVELVDVPERLRLVAEMSVPGKAWLEFEVEDLGDGMSRLHQTAIFHPSGLAGLLYWYGVWPLHSLVFRDMIRAIAKRAGQ